MSSHVTGEADVTAIIVNYRLARGAIRAAESLLAQAASVSVWVVDNSESQREATLLKARLGDRCRVLVNDENVGFGAACNQVYAQTTSEFVFLLNPDAYCLPGALTTLLRFLHAHPQAGGVAPRAYFDDDKRLILPALRVPAWWTPLLYIPKERVGGMLVWLYSLWWRASMIRYWQATRPMSHDGLVGGCLLLRRHALGQSGGLFDPRFFLFYEDADLSLRLRRAGFTLHTVPAAAVVHTAGSTYASQPEWKRDVAHGAGLRFMRKHYGRNRRHAWIRRAYRHLQRAVWQPHIEHVHDTSHAPTWPVPPAWRDGWLLEIGVGPFLLHPGGLFGTGPTAQVPATVWSSLHPGRYFARLGPARAAWLPPTVWTWQIAS